MQNLIARINELSKIAKTRDLTPDEKIERDNLRQEYLKNFREGFKNQLDNLKVVNEKGEDITPKKINK
ncbi:hypothetical protein SSABA_v1c05040 [Spiroplasma sabaudiense Ar-1343]|uniref:Uncharacterized protein n=1 Tax=Spiroplasma sabaudiense Ar-1343 TaxID=1276257 RepID=W6AA73_9MOLU|nr:DUF896 domain-containing protein [Spiroplasma sabaudiense]AHI53911.1 hypothetical protein SSABA_v1c05040 [Spiroplasma sabaudiense Ar-1343]